MIRRITLASPLALASAFLVEQRGVLSLVDTGGSSGAGRILSALRALGRRPEEVRQIVLTHCHGDHAGGARQLKEATGATLIAGADDVRAIDGTGPYPSPPDALFRVTYASLEGFPRVRVDRAIEGRQELEGGLVAIPTPGHTPGHLGVLAPDASALFVGDAVWHLGALRPSWRRLTADPERNSESIRVLAGLGARRVEIAHGPSVRGDRLKRLAKRR